MMSGVELSNGVLSPSLDFNLYPGGHFWNGGRNQSTNRKPSTFDKRIFKLSHSRICPKWDSNLGDNFCKRLCSASACFRPHGHKMSNLVRSKFYQLWKIISIDTHPFCASNKSQWKIDMLWATCIFIKKNMCTYINMSSLSIMWLRLSSGENTLWNLWLYTSDTTIWNNNKIHWF